MFDHWDMAVVEIVSCVLFCFALFRQRGRADKERRLLLMAFFYGLMLEELDMLIFKTYHYHPAFRLRIYGAPLSIAMLWALILVSSMKLTDALGVRSWAKPFSDGALAVLIDIAVDAVAIRLRYWTWILPMDQGFYGVPAGNLYAWICVAFWFSLFARVALQRGKIIWFAALPVASYGMLFLSFLFIGWLGRTFGLAEEAQKFWIFWLLWSFCFLCMMLFRSKKINPMRIAPIYPLSRTLIHLYFIGAYLALNLYKVVPLLFWIAVTALLLDVALHIKASHGYTMHGRGV